MHTCPIKSIKSMNVWTKIENKLRAYASKRGYTCDCCQKEIFDYPYRRVCDACMRSLRRVERVCEKCGRETRADGICLTCKSHIPLFTQGFSPFVYYGDTASVINRVKNGNRRLAFFLGEEMAQTLMSALPDGNVLLIPVPLTKNRYKERGYNQAVELAHSVYAYLKKHNYSARLELNALEKTRESGEQKHLGFLDRAKNVLGAYHLSKRKILEEQTVVLVDDIMTTGATGSECARLIRGAGASAVYLLTAGALPELSL